MHAIVYDMYICYVSIPHKQNIKKRILLFINTSFTESSVHNIKLIDFIILTLYISLLHQTYIQFFVIIGKLPTTVTLQIKSNCLFITKSNHFL